MIPTGYVISVEYGDEIDNRFTYHTPHDSQIERYQTIRDMLKDTANKLVLLTPKSREQSLALTKLEEVVFWANAAIARNEKSGE